MGKFMFILLSSLITGVVLGAPKVTDFVVSSTETSGYSEKEETTSDVVLQNPEIYEMEISSNISNRFATTLIMSKVKNKENVAKETTFTVVLPTKAFISQFIMEVGGKKYKAYVKEKNEAKNIYNQAVSQGQSAGHVAVSARDSNKFTVSVNVEPESKVIFLLTYEELLERKNDQYELVVNIHPGQIVKRLDVKVHINETRPLKYVRTPSLRTGNEISKNNDNLDPSSDIQVFKSTAVVKFNPDSQKQRKYARYLGDKENSGLSGQFVVQYDVERDPFGGEVLLQDGYFVHFFAPSDLQPLPKHVIFVLDSSGSMSGTKISQVKDALRSILKELRSQDILSVIDFGSEINVWDTTRRNKITIAFEYDFNYEDPFDILNKKELPTPTPANNATLNNIKEVIDNLWANGGTNIIGSLETALYLAKQVQDRPTERKYQPTIIFLTDGDPNVGMYSTEGITNIVTRLNKKHNNIPIFSLSFGEDADKEFLRKLSLKNLGFSRHIYEASDASLQLQEFYKQISSPLLSDIKFKYSDDTLEVTKTKFPLYFGGSEIVVTGRYNGTLSDFVRPVECFAPGGPKDFKPTIYNPVTSLERLWAYLTVKQTLDERELTDNQAILTKKALDLAIKYSFVTEVTSLVVVKPNATADTVGTEDAYRLPESADNSLVMRNYPYPIAPISSPQMGPPGYYPTMFVSKAVDYDSVSSLDINESIDSTGSSTAGLNSQVGNRMYSQVDSYYPPGSGSYNAGPYYSSKFGSSNTGQSVSAFQLSGNDDDSSASTTRKPLNIEVLLPWLSSVLNSDGTLTIGQNVYKLGNNQTSPLTTTTCSQTPRNASETGTCSILSQCQVVHPYLTHFSVYQQYFCSISINSELYAGVCCPTTTPIQP